MARWFRSLTPTGMAAVHLNTRVVRSGTERRPLAWSASDEHHPVPDDHAGRRPYDHGHRRPYDHGHPGLERGANRRPELDAARRLHDDGAVGAQHDADGGLPVDLARR